MAVTRPEGKLGAAREALEARGFRVLAAPMLALHPHDDPAYQDVLDGLDQGAFSHVVFTSANGVRHAADRADAARGAGALSRLLEGTTVVAIGPLTADALRARGLPVDAVPDVYSSGGIVDWFAGQDAGTLRVAVVRSTRGSPELTSGLSGLGAEVTEAHVYHLDRPAGGDAHDALFRAVAAGAVDAYTFTSSLTAKHFLEMAEERGHGDATRHALDDAVVAAIGAPTRETLESLDVTVDIVPPDATFASLAAALADARDRTLRTRR